MAREPAVIRVARVHRIVGVRCAQRKPQQPAPAQKQKNRREKEKRLTNAIDADGLILWSLLGKVQRKVDVLGRLLSKTANGQETSAVQVSNAAM